MICPILFQSFYFTTLICFIKLIRFRLNYLFLLHYIWIKNEIKNNAQIYFILDCLMQSSTFICFIAMMLNEYDITFHCTPLILFALFTLFILLQFYHMKIISCIITELFFVDLLHHVCFVRIGLNEDNADSNWKNK